MTPEEVCVVDILFGGFFSSFSSFSLLHHGDFRLSDPLVYLLFIVVV